MGEDALEAALDSDDQAGQLIEFILANDRRIADAALPPDVRLVPVTVDGYGVRFRDDLVLHEGAVPVLSIEGQRSADFAREMAKELIPPKARLPLGVTLLFLAAAILALSLRACGA